MHSSLSERQQLREALQLLTLSDEQSPVQPLPWDAMAWSLSNAFVSSFLPFSFPHFHPFPAPPVILYWRPGRLERVTVYPAPATAQVNITGLSSEDVKVYITSCFRHAPRPGPRTNCFFVKWRSRGEGGEGKSSSD